jgi:hypothetical protein
MTETTLKEYAKLHNVPESTLMFHIENLGFNPVGKKKVLPKGKMSYAWKVSDMDLARAKVKRRMVQL